MMLRLYHDLLEIFAPVIEFKSLNTKEFLQIFVHNQNTQDFLFILLKQFPFFKHLEITFSFQKLSQVSAFKFSLLEKSSIFIVSVDT